MKNKVIFAIFILLFSMSLNAISARAGLGQIYPEDENFEYNPTHFFGELTLEVAPAISAGVGGRYIFFGKIKSLFYEENVDNAYDGAYPIGFERKINGFGAYAKGMAQPEFGESTKIAPFASLSSGFHFVYPTVKLIYNIGDGEETVESTDDVKTVPFIMASAGLEVMFQKIGVFAQANYIKSAKIKYDPYTPVDDIELSPGGEVDPSGLQVFIGVAFH